MLRSTELALIERVLANFESGATDIGEATPTRAEWYTSPERLRDERAALFRSLPVVVGFSSQVASPGDFFTRSWLRVLGPASVPAYITIRKVRG